MDPTVGLITAFFMGVGAFLGILQLAVTTLVVLMIVTDGLAYLVTVKTVLVAETVTRFGVTILVGCTVADGIVVVAGFRLVVDVSVVVAAGC